MIYIITALLHFIMHFTQSVDRFIHSFKNRGFSVPPGVDLRRHHIQCISSHGGDDEPWLPFDRSLNFKSVIPADDERILLGWRKEGFGKHKFNPFPVVPKPGQNSFLAAKRDLKEAIGVEPTEVVSLGRILIVIEHNTEARDEEMMRATGWRGDAFETPELIPSYFPTSPKTYTLFKDGKLSKEKRTSSLDSSLFGSEFDFEVEIQSEETHRAVLPDFSESVTSVDEPAKSAPRGRTNKTLFSSIKQKIRSKSPPSSKDEEAAPADLSNGGSLLLPWHSMYPDDKFWYPLLVSGKKFVGRVDYDVAKEGEDVGRMRRWWFAVVDDD